MPLTPKGYCDGELFEELLPVVEKLAEMPLTPKGYCDRIMFLKSPDS